MMEVIEHIAKGIGFVLACMWIAYWFGLMAYHFLTSDFFKRM